MVIDVTSKPINLDEFFHQAELGTLQLCYEFVTTNEIGNFVNEEKGFLLLKIISKDLLKVLLKKSMISLIK